MLSLGVDRYNPFRGNMSKVLLLSSTEIGCLGLPPPPPTLFIIAKIAVTSLPIIREMAE